MLTEVNGNCNKLNVISEISNDTCLHEPSLIYHQGPLSLTLSIKYVNYFYIYVYKPTRNTKFL